MKTTLLKSLIFLSPWTLSHCTGDKKVDTESRPNILIAMGDDISFPHMSAYGCTWVKTPGFDRVAEQGILFTNAYTPNAKSSPSRACLLTGRNSWQLGEAANHVPFFPPQFVTFMESLGRNGYEVGYTTKGWAPGLALDSAGVPRQLTGEQFNDRKITPPTTGISGSDYAANFEDFLNSGEEGKPFCFWYGSTEPHRGYQYGSGVETGNKKLTDIENVFKFWPDNETVRNDILDYALEIEYFDSHLAKMLDILEARGELANTIVIVTADNGMPFPRIKGQAYEYSNHMPLAIMWGKGIKNPGRIISDFTSSIDFAPTILEVAGINESESGLQPIQGSSLTDIFKSGKNWSIDKKRDHVLIGKERHDVGRPDDIGYPIRGIVKDDFLYLINFKPQRWPGGNPETGYLNCDASPTKTVILNLKRNKTEPVFWNLSFGFRDNDELYNISADPECMNNLAENHGFNTLKQGLRQQLLSELRDQEDPRILGSGDIFDKYTYASEDTRDFYNRYIRGELFRKSAGWVDSTDFEKF